MKRDKMPTYATSKRRRNDEHKHAEAFVKYVRFKHPKVFEVMFHVPNGGWRTAKTALDLQAEGVKKGVPDYCIPYPVGRWHGMFLELKSETGRPSSEQKSYLSNVTQLGYFATVAKGWEEAVTLLEAYLSNTNIVSE